MTAEGLTEAEREALRDATQHVSSACAGWPCVTCEANFTAVERILADRLAAVQAERDEWKAATSRTQSWALDELARADKSAESAEAERDAARREERMRAEDHARAWQRVAEVEAERDALRERVEAKLGDPRWRDDVDGDWLEDALRAALVGRR